MFFVATQRAAKEMPSADLVELNYFALELLLAAEMPIEADNSTVISWFGNLTLSSDVKMFMRNYFMQKLVSS